VPGACTSRAARAVGAHHCQGLATSHAARAVARIGAGGLHRPRRLLGCNRARAVAMPSRSSCSLRASRVRAPQTPMAIDVARSSLFYYSGARGLQYYRTPRILPNVDDRCDLHGNGRLKTPATRQRTKDHDPWHPSTSIGAILGAAPGLLKDALAALRERRAIRAQLAFCENASLPTITSQRPA